MNVDAFLAGLGIGVLATCVLLIILTLLEQKK